MTDTALGQLVLLLTTVSGFALQIYREKRNRAWDLEDRMAAREELKGKVEGGHEQVIQKIEENTEMNRVALKEANDINQKLYAMSTLINSAFDRRAANYRRRQTDAPGAASASGEPHTADEAPAKVDMTENTLP